MTFPLSALADSHGAFSAGRNLYRYGSLANSPNDDAADQEPAGRREREDDERDWHIQDIAGARIVAETIRNRAGSDVLKHRRVTSLPRYGRRSGWERVQRWCQ